MISRPKRGGREKPPDGGLCCCCCCCCPALACGADNGDGDDDEGGGGSWSGSSVRSMTATSGSRGATEGGCEGGLGVDMAGRRKSKPSPTNRWCGGTGERTGGRAEAAVGAAGAGAGAGAASVDDNDNDDDDAGVGEDETSMVGDNNSPYRPQGTLWWCW